MSEVDGMVPEVDEVASRFEEFADRFDECRRLLELRLVGRGFCAFVGEDLGFGYVGSPAMPPRLNPGFDFGPHSLRLFEPFESSRVFGLCVCSSSGVVLWAGEVVKFWDTWIDAACVEDLSWVRAPWSWQGGAGV